MRQVKLLLAESASYMSAVPVSAPALVIQLCANVPRKTGEDGLGDRTPFTHTGNLEELLAPGSWLCTGPALSVVAT